MLEELKNAIIKEQANGIRELVVVCGFNAYDKLSKELPLALTNNCGEIMGLPLYRLEWMPTNQIQIGGKELLIPPPCWNKPYMPDSVETPDILTRIRKYEMPTDLFPVISEPLLTPEQIIKKATEGFIVSTCFDLHIDPDILKKQSAELVKQKNIIENTAEMINNGKLLRRPCALGTIVYIVENRKMYQGTVIRYEQVLSPKLDTELLFADIELHGINTVVRRNFSEFGNNIFVDAEKAKNKLKEQISNK